MAEVLVVVEQSGGAVKKVTLEMLTLARTLGEPAAVVLGAPGTAAAVTGKLGEYGATKVYAAESEDLAGYLVAPKATGTTGEKGSIGNNERMTASAVRIARDRLIPSS